jgi:hypothetical protein
MSGRWINLKWPSIRLHQLRHRDGTICLAARHNPRVLARVSLAFAFMMAAGTVSAAVPPTPPPATLVLRPADLGAAYSDQGTRVGNTSAARGAPPGFGAKLARWGRIGGYEVDLTRRANPATLQDGPLEIKSSASVYRNKTGARAAFAYARRHLVPRSYVPLALGFAVGEEARQWVSQGESGLGTLLEYILIWREANIDASIVLTGRVGVVSAADVAPLAHKQESRIRAALH